ncbi:MAG: hypothetical protein D8M59_04870 [Planctomycetes bacterium]|nr:hypothetical protein [Planctomycetota bacterium]
MINHPTKQVSILAKSDVGGASEMFLQWERLRPCDFDIQSLRQWEDAGPCFLWRKSHINLD